MNTQESKNEIKQISNIMEQPRPSEILLHKELAKIKASNSPPTEYINWDKPLKWDKAFNMNQLIKLDSLVLIDGQFEETSYSNINNCTHYYPNILGPRDIMNIVKMASIRHKRLGLNIADVIQYNPNTYINSVDQYNVKKQMYNDTYSTDSVLDSKEDFAEKIAKTKVEKAKKESTVASMVQRYKNIKLDFINVIKAERLLAIFNTEYNIEPLKFWEYIATIQISNTDTESTWKVDHIYVLYIMQLSEYTDIYNSLYEKLNPTISDYRLKNTGIIHYIILRGEAFYKCVYDAPDFVIFMLDEQEYFYIPKLFTNTV